MIPFYKYQGTGNDFVMIDNREVKLDRNNLDLLQKMCSRRFGIGADGLILIENHVDFDFEMVYFNSDGSQSFCGNGARCAVRFASDLEMFKNECSFLAIDGSHEAKLSSKEVSIKMGDVNEVKRHDDHSFELYTGSPHFIHFVEKLTDVDIFEFGKKIRYSEKYSKKGINVNAVEVQNQKISMLTYERGVEAETFSCGTGATAAAIAFSIFKNLDIEKVPVQVKGGSLTISFDKISDNHFQNIWLSGLAKKVFEGKYE